MEILKKAYNKLKSGLQKTRSALAGGLQQLLSSYRTIDDELLMELEELLITADIGVETTDRIIEELKRAYKENEIEDVEEIKPFLKEYLVSILEEHDDRTVNWNPEGPTGILVVGVNGSGKTTSIAKLSQHISTEQDRTSIFAAGDTFRAAAIDQIERWANELDVDLVKHQSGGDAGAVVYDAAEAAKSREIDALFVDTAGRLHTEKNLMKELGKIRRVLSEQIEGAPQETLLVIDATVGQNAIKQAKKFNDFTDLTGIVLAKLDGTARGGVVIPIQQQLGIPVKYVGVGESKEDIVPFDPEVYVDSLFGER